jgi:hypothetical protein
VWQRSLLEKLPIVAHIQDAYRGMSDSGHRSCKCGAVYARSEAMAPGRQISSFQCSVCGVTMEHWNTTWVPAYRLIAGPVRMTDATK